MIVGLDVRPALFGCTGFARVARETLRALARRPDLEVRGYGVCWRRATQRALPGPVLRRRLPARLQALLAPLGFGVETLLGRLDVFHHTDLVFAPVRRAPEVLTVNDLSFLEDERWHGPGFRRRVEPRLRRRAARAAALAVPSSAVARDVVAQGLAPASRVHVVPYGADHLDPRPAPDEPRRLARLMARAGWSGRPARLVLAPGTREPRKNLARLIRAFGMASAALPPAAGGRTVPAAALLLVGPRGWCCEALEQELQARSFGPAVAALGEVAEADYQALLRDADVVAYPSLAEGFGLPVAEAMRCGRAVLTSRDTPMAQLGGEAVRSVDPCDLDAMARALAELLQDASLRAGLGAAAARRAAGLTWDGTAQRLAALYRAAAGGE